MKIAENESKWVKGPHSEKSHHRLGRWAVEFGVGVLSTNDTVGDITGQFDTLAGEYGADIYKLSVYYTVKKFQWEMGNYVFYPQLDVFPSITRFEENSGDGYHNMNFAGTLKWTDFHWNKYLYTTLAMGVGLGYFEQINSYDRIKHADKERSQWKFYWPIQLTLALPQFKRHQVVLYNDHWSGGFGVFDDGGFDTYGIAYRFIFYE
ncbi:hypothetical protein [Desulfobacter latus]|uniref:Uncharacterized protein n=1 Tax=Desulfobacter latus TaxID=2292 RepID=A0A850SV41_9BACT|nr:hypothetical protein [Desulfobacter latus]NWH03900.1 hypothetical protein [Desulfobacter latus]